MTAQEEDVNKTLISFYERLRKYDAKGLDGKAVALCDKILKVESNPGHQRQVLKTKCVCLLRQQKLQAALEIAEREGFTLERAFVLYKQKRNKEALETLDQVNPTLSENAAATNLRAQLLYRMGNYEEARALYAELVQGAGDGVMNEFIANFLASSLLAGNVEAVLEIFDQGLLSGRESGDAFELLYNKACALLAVGNHQGAADALQTAIELGQVFLQEDDRLTDANIASELAVLKVQRAFALQQGLVTLTSSSEVEDCKAEILNLLSEALSSNAQDKSVCAVASNNLLALRGDHEVFDSFKRMRLHASDPQNLEALPQSSQETIALNRVLLLLKMNKSKECSKLAEELRGEFPQLKSLDLAEAVALDHDGKADLRDRLIEEKLEQSLKRNEVSHAALFVLAQAQFQLNAGEIEAALSTLKARPELNRQPSIVEASLKLCHYLGYDDEAKALLADTTSTKSTLGDQENSIQLAMLQAKVYMQGDGAVEAAKIYEDIFTGKFGPVDGELRMEALANYVLAAALFDTDAAEAKAKALPMPAGVDDVNVEALEAEGLTQQKARPRRVRSVVASSDGAARTPAAEDAAKKLRSIENKRNKELKKRAKRREAHLAKLKERNGADFDTTKEKVDPERWIPKNMRQAALKARKKRNAKLTGAQGANSVNASEAARLDARASLSATAPASAGTSSASSRSKSKKKGRR